jgi:hypothetical protein
MIELNVVSPRFEIADRATRDQNGIREKGKNHKKKHFASRIHVSLSFLTNKSISTLHRMQAMVRSLLDGHRNAPFVA